MFLTDKTNWSLLAKHLSGETSEKENQAISEWLGQKPGNLALYKQLKEDWTIMDTMNKQFNVDNAWSKLHSRILASEQPVTIAAGQVRNSNRSYPYLITPLRIAAAVLLVAAIGASAVFMVNRMQKVQVIAGVSERAKNTVLPDGSSVTLNAGSRISYQKSFGKGSRELKLEGEAYFEVAQDKDRPFSIYAKDARIQVLGTSFNVDASRDDQGVEVYVSTGVVQLAEADNLENKIILRSGNTGHLYNSEVRSGIAENENSMAWLTGDVDFSGLLIPEATAILNEIYHVSIVCRGKGIDTIRIDEGERFHDESLDVILQVICKQSNLKLEKSDNMIYLSAQ